MNIMSYLKDSHEKALAQNWLNSKFKILSCLLYGEINPRFFVTFDNKKIAYLVISKNACTSIKAALIDNLVTGVDVHYSEKFKNTFNKLPSEKEDYFKFTFVRNPFERAVSCYVNKFKEYKNRDNFFIFKKYLRGYLKEKDSFTAFINKISTIPDRFSDMHFKSQYSFIYEKGKSVVDYCGKVENLKEDFAPIQKKYNLGSLIIQNKTSNKDRRSFYNEDLAEKMYKRYKKDFDIRYPEEYEKLIHYLEGV
ncbi:MAG TPA: sulfotransferase family 2 domain-containing protein [Candidatus Absconditabacterales bacterium]|nr:sulfotransferase family 2 domain-containing protein [Candidatus Absconditabacterales bacterium]